MSYKKTIAGPYGSEEVDMTPEEIAERQAEEAKPPAPLPFQQRIRQAYISLPIELQEKYEPEITMAAFHLERGNYEMVARKILQAEAKITPGEDAVQTIITAAKVELGLQ